MMVIARFETQELGLLKVRVISEEGGNVQNVPCSFYLYSTKLAAALCNAISAVLPILRKKDLRHALIRSIEEFLSMSASLLLMSSKRQAGVIESAGGAAKFLMPSDRHRIGLGICFAFVPFCLPEQKAVLYHAFAGISCSPFIPRRCGCGGRSLSQRTGLLVIAKEWYFSANALKAVVGSPPWQPLSHGEASAYRSRVRRQPVST